MMWNRNEFCARREMSSPTKRICVPIEKPMVVMHRVKVEMKRCKAASTTDLWWMAISGHKMLTDTYEMQSRCSIV